MWYYDENEVLQESLKVKEWVQQVIKLSDESRLIGWPDCSSGTDPTEYNLAPTVPRGF